MNIPKAIEILKTFRDEGVEDLPLDVEPAINLGIEALDLVLRERLLCINPAETKLPSETEDQAGEG